MMATTLGDVRYLNATDRPILVTHEDGHNEVIMPGAYRTSEGYERFIKQGLSKVIQRENGVLFLTPQSRLLRVQGEEGGGAFMNGPGIPARLLRSTTISPLSSQRLTPDVVDAITRQGLEIVVRYTGTFGDAIVTTWALCAFVTRYPHLRQKMVIQENTGATDVIDRFEGVPRREAPWLSVEDKVVLSMMMGQLRSPGDLNRAWIWGEGISWADAYSFAFGFSELPKPPPYNVLETDLVRPKKHLEAGKGRKVVVLHLTTSHSFSKSYPKSLGHALLDSLVKMQDIFPIVIGGRGEHKFEHDGVLSLVGKLKLTESLALLSLADLSITIDSWAWHASRLLNVPCIALFGSTRPVGFPKSWDRCVVLRGRPCVGHEACSKYSCEKNDCINTIDPKRVVALVASRLEKSSEI